VDSDSTTLPGPDGVGLELALAGYGRHLKNTKLARSLAVSDAAPVAKEYDSYDQDGTFYSEVEIGGASGDAKSYKWWEAKWPIGYDEVAPPAEYPAIISRLITDEYHARICENYFPNDTSSQWDYDDLNDYTGGWSDRESQRLLFVNGAWDPWIDTTVSSRFRPGGPLEDTPEVPVKVIPGGNHCDDLGGDFCSMNEDCNQVMSWAIDQIAEWVAEFQTDE
jgi:hypothetical protein